MFRDEISGCSESPRPPRKRMPRVLIVVVVVLAGLGLAHVAGLTELFTTRAWQSSQDSSSNLGTPTGRPRDDWDSDDDEMLQRVYDLVAREPNQGTGVVDPFAIRALRSSQSGPRNLQTPASRLIGDWESDNDPMFPRVCHLVPQEPNYGTGLYMAGTVGSMREVIYKIVSEDRSGASLVMAECLPRTGANYRVRYSVAKDGQSMTREYEGPNGHVSSQYRYLGPPTEALPQECPFR